MRLHYRERRATLVAALAQLMPQAALTGVPAAVVGVIANLAVFFGIRVLYPETGGFDVFAAVLAVAALVVLRRFTIQTYYLVPAGALAGMDWVLLGMR